MQNRVLSKLNNWVVFVLFTVAVFAVVLYSMVLIRELRQRETRSIEVFAKAMKIQQTKIQIDSETQDLLLSVFTENDNLPTIITDGNKNAILAEGFYKNIPPEILADSAKIRQMIRTMESHYAPFKLQIEKGKNQFVFYDNSQLLNNLRFFPYFLGVFILCYLLFSFWFLRTVKRTDEGLVWAGLAKETAHQIGTPLSSMIGWIEVMRDENPDSIGAKEIEKDIYRLKTISERFSKIGSVPELNDLNLNETVQINFDYLKSRISRKVNFGLKMPPQPLLIPHNRILLSWVIENLVKNAVDAMKGAGTLDILVYEKQKNILIDIKDTGSGMTGMQAKNAFKPGFSTKKRGWGLGLSLAKRVVTEYHNGDIKIANTEPGKGTTFRIVLKNS